MVGLPKPQVYPAGHELVRQGAGSGSVYFIADGLVKLIHVHPGGQASIVGLRSHGWIVGAAAVIQQQPFAVTATTATKCVLHCFAAERFRALIQEQSPLSWYLHEMHSHEVYEQLTQVANLSALPARQRLMQFLEGLQPLLPSRAAQKGIRLEIPLRLWEVAQLISVTPPYLSELLRDLERDGVIRREKGWLFLQSRRESVFGAL